MISGGEFYGMQTFDQSLVKLVNEGLVTEDDARRAATNPHDFDLQLRGVLDRLSSMSGRTPRPELALLGAAWSGRFGARSPAAICARISMGWRR